VEQLTGQRLDVPVASQLLFQLRNRSAQTVAISCGYRGGKFGVTEPPKHFAAPLIGAPLPSMRFLVLIHTETENKKHSLMSLQTMFRPIIKLLNFQDK